jgi:hypothetical protein
MTLMGIASSMGATQSSLEDLLNGQAGPGVSGLFDCTPTSLQEFLQGGTSISLASVCGTTPANLQELRDQIGDQGAVGFIIGLAIGRAQQKSHSL